LNIKNFFIIIFSLFFFNNVLANENKKIVYINVDFILNNSILGKNILNDLKKINNKNLENISSTEKELKKENDEIAKVKNIISKEEFENRINDLKKKIDNFNSLKDKLSIELNQLRQKEIKNFFKKINPLIQVYMDENFIDIIIDKKNIFIARSDYDITTDIINLIDNEFK
jgi:Skp family chaperone for outer membrane proteins